MKRYVALFLSIFAVLLISSCDMGPNGIDSIEDAKTATEILFEASYSDVFECHATGGPSGCLTIEVPGNGVIELCIENPDALSNSEFYNELNFEQGLVISISFSDVDVTYSKTGTDYTLNGECASYGSIGIDGFSAQVIWVVYGDVEIDGEDFSDTANYDVKYTCQVSYTGTSLVIAGSVEGTVNEYDIDDDDWEYTIPL